MSNVRLRVISLGAGVQSTTMALMAARGELTPMPDAAIFADTGWEPRRVYAHLDWLMSSGLLPFPVYRVSAGNIREDLVRGWTKHSGKFVNVPFHLREYDNPGDGDGVGIGRRQCTGHYKIMPIRNKERELLGVGPRGRVPAGAVEKWMGISTDEIFRVKEADVAFELNRYPLIEVRMSRGDCLMWIERHGYPTPPKSSCIGCPLHNNGHWRDMKLNAPDEWADAVAMDQVIRKPRDGKLRFNRAEQFMHYDAVPLTEVDLTTEEDHGQLNLFNNDCSGYCGV